MALATTKPQTLGEALRLVNQHLDEAHTNALQVMTTVAGVPRKKTARAINADLEILATLVKLATALDPRLYATKELVTRESRDRIEAPSIFSRDRAEAKYYDERHKR